MNLNFTLKNTNPVAKDKAVVYRNTAPTFNTLELTVTNQGDDLYLKGGVPVRESSIQPNGATTMYIDPATVFACGLTALGQLDVKADGYNTRFFHDQGGTWALSPAKDGTLAAGASITITISSITIGANALTGNIPLDYYNFSGSADNVVLMAIQVANKPVVGNKDLTSELALTWDDNGYQDVYMTTRSAQPFINGLSFTLRNNGGDAIKSGSKTEFSLSFVYADNPGYGALCTVQEGTNIAITQTTAANHWSGGKDRQAPVPIWRFTPQGKVLGTGQDAIASFSLGQLVSTLQPGPTLMYLSWVNVPDYNDGQISLGITKLMPPVIHIFTANPAALVFASTTDTKQVELNWEVLHWKNKLVQINNTAFPASGKKNFPVQYHAGGVKMSLSVVFGNNEHVAKQSITIGTAMQGPVVKCLDTSIDLLTFREKDPIPVKCSWAVCYAEQVYFAGTLVSGVQPKSGSHIANFSFTDMAPLKEYENIPGYLLTLIAEGYTSGDSVTQSTPVFQWSTPSIYPDLTKSLSLISGVAGRLWSQYPFLLNLVLLEEVSSFMGSFFDKTAPIKSLVALISLVKEAADQGTPDWPCIKSYATIPAYMLQQIGDLGTNEIKASWQFQVSKVETNLNNQNVMNGLYGRMTREELQVVFPVARGYVRFMNVLYLTSQATDAMNTLTKQMNTLVSSKTPAAAKAVLATCGGLVDFIYAMEKLPRARR